MGWSRYEPPRNPGLPQVAVELFDRPAANGPHPWICGTAKAITNPDPGAAMAAELAALREQARAEGFAAGLDEARTCAQAEVEDVRARWAAGLEALVRQSLEIADERRREMCELALWVAEAVLQTELGTGDAIERLVAAGLRALAGDDETTLVLSSIDAERTGARLQERWPGLALRVDAALSPGAVRLESRVGTVETSIAERLARARSLVLGESMGDDP